MKRGVSDVGYVVSLYSLDFLVLRSLIRLIYVEGLMLMKISSIKMITEGTDVTTTSIIVTDLARSVDRRPRRSIMLRLIALRKVFLTRCLVHIWGHL